MDLLAGFRFLKIKKNNNKTTEKNPKQSVIFVIALRDLCMQVLHGDLQVIHYDFQLVSTMHSSWCISEYKSVLLLFSYATKLPIYLKVLTITVKMSLLLFSPVEPVYG